MMFTFLNGVGKPFRSLAGGAAPAFAPTDISNLALWLDADDTATITHTSGSVSQWDDKSGNAYHAVQASGSSQPVTGTRTLNGLNVLDLDGSNDFMTLSSGLYDFPAGANTVIFTCQSDTNAASQAFFRESAYRIEILGGTSQVRMYNGSGQRVVNDIDSALPGIIVARRDGTNLTLNHSNGKSSTGTGATNATLSQLRLGTAGFNYFNGIFAEICVYKKSLSDAEVNQLGEYLGTKWGITWTAI